MAIIQNLIYEIVAVSLRDKLIRSDEQEKLMRDLIDLKDDEIKRRHVALLPR